MRPVGPSTVLLVGCAPREAEPGAELTQAWAGSGEITWLAVFDEEAKQQGQSDCQFTRRYTATEDRSVPWLCPGCEGVLDAWGEVVEGEACALAVSGRSGPSHERFGWDAAWMWRGADLGPSGELWYSPLIVLGQREDTPPQTLTFVGYAREGQAQLLAEGWFELERVPVDPWNGMSPPASYSCGWPRSDPPPYEGRWEVAAGGMLPDGWFQDGCSEPVRLHDLAGRYLVVDIGASDCGPCQWMAAETDDLLRELRGLGIPVESVSLLSRSLGAPLESPSSGELTAWSEAWSLSSPVLGDRGWGYAMSQTLWPDDFAYPTWLVVSPAFEVLGAGQGYGGPGPLRDLVVSHWAQQGE
jgi:thiol-disulfide isomerase/thioredoxin